MTAHTLSIGCYSIISKVYCLKFTGVSYSCVEQSLFSLFGSATPLLIFLLIEAQNINNWGSHYVRTKLVAPITNIKVIFDGPGFYFWTLSFYVAPGSSSRWVQINPPSNTDNSDGLWMRFFGDKCFYSLIENVRYSVVFYQIYCHMSKNMTKVYSVSLQ